jgi:hypothetical protein
MSVVKGRHAMKFGVDVNLVHDVLINLFQGEGVYSYTGAPTVAFGNWVADVYNVDLGDGRTGRHYTSFTQATDPITQRLPDSEPDLYGSQFGNVTQYIVRTTPVAVLGKDRILTPAV